MARFPAPRAASLPEPDSEAALPDATPAIPRVLPTSQARRTRRSSSAVQWGKTSKNNEEHKQLAQWAEHLHHELLSMTKERDILAQQLSDAQVANEQLQLDFDNLSRRSAHFERMMCGNHGDLADLDALRETSDLRSQLHDHRVELEQLRAERSNLMTLHRRSQEVVQQLHREREELRAKHQELKGVHEESKAQCSYAKKCFEEFFISFCLSTKLAGYWSVFSMCIWGWQLDFLREFSSFIPKTFDGLNLNVE